MNFPVPAASFFVAASLTFSTTALTAGEQPSAISDATTWKVLEAGKVAILTPPASSADKDDCRQVVAGILIDHPVRSVWGVIDDVESADDYIKDLKAAKIIEKTAAHRLVEQKLKIGPLPMFTYVIKHETTPHSRVDFSRVSGDLKSVDGYWEFHPVDSGNKTLLIYGLKIAPGIPVPGFVLRNSMKKSLPDALISVKKRVESLAG